MRKVQLLAYIFKNKFQINKKFVRQPNSNNKNNRNINIWFYKF